MGESENSEIKILIDALKYTSNIIVDLTNKLTLQEEKITILENKLTKIQKVSMENNLKLKTIDVDELNKIILSNKKNNSVNNNNDSNHNLDSDKITEYIIEKNNKPKSSTHTNQQNILSSIVGDKNKIDKLIDSIIKRKNDLNQLINNENDLIIEYSNIKKNKLNVDNSGLDLTMKTATNKSNFDESKNIHEKLEIESKINNIKEEENITKAQNNDLDKANNILKQIRRKANIRRI